MTRRDRLVLLGMAAVAIALPALTLLGVHSDVLSAGPLLLFALPLLAGRYIGEEQIARLAGARTPVRRRRAPAALAVSLRRCPRAMPRGGRLIAASLAVRPPPAVPSLIA